MAVDKVGAAYVIDYIDDRIVESFKPAWADAVKILCVEAGLANVADALAELPAIFMTGDGFAVGTS